MNSYTEKLEYEEKMDRISEYLEELILDAIMAALNKMMHRNWHFANLANQPQPDKMTF